MINLPVRWSAPEYHHYKRSNDWFWAVGIVVVSIFILSFFLHNVLFGILILISVGVLIFFVLREPKEVRYEINNQGITVGDELHPYLAIESFWVETRKGEPKIILKTKKMVTPFIMIPIHGEDADEAIEILKNFLDEKELSEPSSHKIMEYLGF